MSPLAPIAALALLPILAACQEERINPLPAPEPVDMAWLQAEITEHTGAPAQSDAIASVLHAVAQMQAIADELRPKHEEQVGADLPEVPDLGWLLRGYGDLDAPEGLLAYAEDVFTAMGDRGVWATLDQAAAAEGLHVAQFDSYDVLKDRLTLTGLRRLMRAAELRCQRAAAAGDAAEVANSISHILVMARTASISSTSIGYLVAAGMQHRAEELTRRHAQVLLSDRGQIARLSALLARHERLVPVQVSFELERRFGRRGLDLLYAPAPLKPSDPPEMVRITPVKDSPFLSLFGGDEPPEELAPLADVLAAMDQVDQAMLDAISLPRLERAAAMRELLALEDSLDNSVWPVNTWPGAHAKLVEEHDERLTRMTLLRTMLAVELFRHDHGRPPTSLDKLVPDYLPELPPDPLGHGPLKYRLAKEGEAFPGNPDYLLYSVGVDGEDNGPTLPDYDHDAFYESERTRGCDYVINILPDRD